MINGWPVVRTEPEVTDYEVYAGLASLFDFKGLVRHYFMRRGSANVADVLGLVHKRVVDFHQRKFELTSKDTTILKEKKIAGRGAFGDFSFKRIKIGSSRLALLASDRQITEEGLFDREETIAHSQFSQQ